MEPFNVILDFQNIIFFISNKGGPPQVYRGFQYHLFALCKKNTETVIIMQSQMIMNLKMIKDNFLMNSLLYGMPLPLTLRFLKVRKKVWLWRRRNYLYFHSNILSYAERKKCQHIICNVITRGHLMTFKITTYHNIPFFARCISRRVPFVGLLFAFSMYPFSSMSNNIDSSAWSLQNCKSLMLTYV